MAQTAYTQVDAAEISNIKTHDDEDVDMVCFTHNGIHYVYYLNFVDAFWGMIEKNDITLNPYLHDDYEMCKSGTLGIWDEDKKTAIFKTKWLNKNDK